MKEIEEVDYTGHEIASTTRRYRKLVVESDFAMNFGTGVFYCSGELFNEVIKYYSAAVTFLSKSN